jgi:hypothetical protein
MRKLLIFIIVLLLLISLINCKPSDGNRFIFGNQWGEEGTDDGQFDTPKGIFIFPDVEIGRKKGRVILTDTFNHRVQIFDLEGQFIDSWGSYGQDPGQFDTPSGAAVNIQIGGNIETGKRGRVILTDTFNHRVQIFDFGGNLVTTFGEEGSGDGQMNQPTSVATAPISIDDGLDRKKGRVILTDTFNHRVQIFDMEGNFIGAFGSQGTGEGEFNNPTGIYYTEIDAGGTTRGKRGRIILTDTFNHRVQIFDEDGNLINMFGSEGIGEGEFSEPRGVTMDVMGNIYVADTNNHRVQIFDVDGNFIESIGQQGSGEGEFESPEGVAIGPNGNLFVSDTGNHRVQVFDLQSPSLNEFIVETKASITAGVAETVTITAKDQDGNDFALDGTVEIATTNPNIAIDTPSITLTGGTGEAQVTFSGSGSTELVAVYGYIISQSPTFNVDGTVIYVSSTTGNDTYDGTEAEPLQHINTAIDQLAADGVYGRILVAEGTYSFPDANTNIITVKEGISLYGGYNPVDWTRDIATYQTIIEDTRASGGTQDVPIAPIYIDSSVSNITTIDGFYINGSISDTSNSAGIHIDGGSATISKNVITGGSTAGSGPRSYGVFVNDSDDSLEIKSNHIDGGSGTSAYGIYLKNTTMHLYNNTIIGTTDTAGTGTENSYAIYLDGAMPIIRNNIADGGNPQAGVPTRNSISVMLFNISNPIIENNILVTSGGTNKYGIYALNVGNEPTSIMNNDIYDLGGAITGLYYDGATDYLTAVDLNTSLAYADGNLSEDAMLDTVNDYVFTVSSPVSVTEGGIDGSALGWIFDTDKDGTVRTGNGTTGWSMGAYEKD